MDRNPSCLRGAPSMSDESARLKAQHDSYKQCPDKALSFRFDPTHSIPAETLVAYLVDEHGRIVDQP